MAATSMPLSLAGRAGRAVAALEVLPTMAARVGLLLEPQQVPIMG